MMIAFEYCSEGHLVRCRECGAVFLFFVFFLLLLSVRLDLMNGEVNLSWYALIVIIWALMGLIWH